MKKKLIIITFITIISGVFAISIILNANKDNKLDSNKKKNESYINKNEDAKLESEEQTNIESQDKSEKTENNDKEKESTETKEPKKEETNKSNTTPDKKETTGNNTSKKDTSEEVKPKEEQIVKLSFEKNNITKAIIGYPPNQFTGDEVVISSSEPFILLSDLKKLNKLSISIGTLSDDKITWSSLNKEIADFKDDKLMVYRFGETTIKATIDNLSASYKLNIVSVINNSAYIQRERDYKKSTMPYVIYMKVGHSSQSRCPQKKYKYDVELKLYRNGTLIKTDKKETNDSASILYADEDQEGVYYGEYKITDLCTNYSINGKTKEKEITIN